VSGPVTEPTTAVITDGRMARRDRNRSAVIDVVISLFSEGVLDPDPDEVAARCGLSPRSVYRYFEDREGLVRAAIDQHFEQVRPLTVIHAIGEGDLDDRIDRFVDARLRLYEAVAASARAARRAAEHSPILAEQVMHTRRALQEQVERHFAPEWQAFGTRRRRAVALTVDTLFQFEGLDHCRQHRGLSLRECRVVLREALHAALDRSSDG
jgi:TetR/AcrR family transcriptional regulator of autoinduction and epiphytic fitness